MAYNYLTVHRWQGTLEEMMAIADILKALTPEELALLDRVTTIHRPNLTKQDEFKFNLGMNMGKLPPK